MQSLIHPTHFYCGPKEVVFSALTNEMWSFLNGLINLSSEGKINLYTDTNLFHKLDYFFFLFFFSIYSFDLLN